LVFPCSLFLLYEDAAQMLHDAGRMTEAQRRNACFYKAFEKMVTGCIAGRSRKDCLS
jgi:hypothetical protein